ncbi:MAG: hypothetical protein JSS49_20775 [Planctomycetes bacterium]|nr:hypothetical protein [Planctomycetota bacterium]
MRTGFALAACRAEQGSYPKNLDELVPEFLTAVPLDKYTDKPLIYTPLENGFLVYSVGANGMDDGGQESNGRKVDDIGLQVPIPPDAKP